MAQTILNQKDRSTSFWKFFLMFLFATAFIVLAVFFNYNLSDKETKILRSEVERYRTQERAQSKFVANIDQAKKLIDSLSSPGANVAYLNQQVANQISEITNRQYLDSTFYGAMNKNMVDVFLRYLDVTNKVVKYGDAPSQLEETRAKYEQALRDNDNLRKENDILHRMNNGVGAD